ERFFGYENEVCSAGQSSVRRDPSCMTPHNFYYHDSIMRFACGLNSVYRVDGHVDGGIKTEREIGTVNIIVDGFWDADTFESHLREFCANAEGVLSADDD